MARAKQTQKEVELVTAQEEIQEEIQEEVKTGDVVGIEPETPAVEVANDTVTICSNYPRDLKYMVPDRNGHMVAITIKGNASHLVGKASGILPVGAYGITTGVPKEAWEWIVAHRPDDKLIKNGLVFAAATKTAKAAAKERSGLRNGYEPLDMKKSSNSRPVEN